ncbi:MAG TPA: hypothetical protein VLV83_14195 [Acidobacteriota bacterium]|nr:hypothetical protein [Acidobacteriota bacterium]
MSRPTPKRLAPLLIFCLAPLALVLAQDWDEDRSQAEAQYEIIKLLIKNDEFGKVPAATQKLFSLKFPESAEQHFVDTAERISAALSDKHQYDVAHSVLDQALKACKKKKSHGRLYKEKAWIFKKQGNDGDAMKYFEMANKMLAEVPGS